MLSKVVNMYARCESPGNAKIACDELCRSNSSTYGKELEGHVTLMNMYAECESRKDARFVFDELRNSSSSSNIL